MIFRCAALVKASAVLLPIIAISNAQTDAPTEEPTKFPTESPSKAPTDIPTDVPTDIPTDIPTESPSKFPTDIPTDVPTKIPTDIPTDVPTKIPTEIPTDVPTETPTDVPTESPTEIPTDVPTESPSKFPTSSPTESPSEFPTSSPTESPTVLIGCPPRYVQTNVPGDYERGELVSTPFQSWGGDVLAVYECRSDDNYLHCPRTGFEPGTLYSSEAWIYRGSCNDAVAFLEPTASPTEFPTTSPTHPLWEEEGCPEGYAGSGGYGEGDVVEKDGLVYECRVWPDSLYCVQAAFAPGTLYSGSAWNMLGSCTGTLTPPAGVSCSDPPYDPSRAVPYEQGDTVSHNEKVYECMSWPNSLFCPQSAFSPGGIYSGSAWIDLGACGEDTQGMEVTTEDAILSEESPQDVTAAYFADLALSEGVSSSSEPGPIGQEEGLAAAPILNDSSPEPEPVIIQDGASPAEPPIVSEESPQDVTAQYFADLAIPIESSSLSEPEPIIQEEDLAAAPILEESLAESEPIIIQDSMVPVEPPIVAHHEEPHKTADELEGLE